MAQAAWHPAYASGPAIAVPDVATVMAAMMVVLVFMCRRSCLTGKAMFVSLYKFYLLV